MADQYDFSDPYYRVIPLAGTQFVQTSRSIVLTQGAGMDGVVGVAGDKDILVFADEVTIKGQVSVTRAPAQSVVNGVPTVADGGHVVILARKVDTQTDASGDAMLVLTGSTGWTTSDETWTAAPTAGTEGTAGVPAVYDDQDHLEQAPAPGGTGQSSLDASGNFDPTSPLNGQDGANGGAGGAGGSFELRCYSLESTVALGANVSGGNGGDGENGQPGAKGGKGGPGGQPGNDFWKVYIGTGGGNGGRGGNGGNGGDAGPGGATGSISIWVVNGSPDGVTRAITCTLGAGAPGTKGTHGKHGDGGDAGPGDPDLNPPLPDGQQGADGTDGTDGNDEDDGITEVDPSIAAPLVDGKALIANLTQPLSPYLGMMLDKMRAAYLEVTAAVSDDVLADLDDQLTWVSMLATAYAADPPIDPNEQAALDAVLARTQVMQEHVSRGLDYFGRAPTFAPLGSLELYKSQFSTTDLPALVQVRTDYSQNLTALENATATSDQIAAAVAKLKANQAFYTGDPQKAEQPGDPPTLADTLRATIAQLVVQVNGHDSDVVDANAALVKAATDTFKQAVMDSFESSLTFEDFIDAIGQFGFFGEKQFQQAAMIVSETGKLLSKFGPSSNCLADDGTDVPKQWVLAQLSPVENLQQALSGYAGTINGITLSDPGAVKLIGIQEQLDDVLSKFWTYTGASDCKVAFDEYVSAVQTRNADILTLNESIAQLRRCIAEGAQTAAEITAAEDAASAHSTPGAAILVTQLARMVTRATDDCIRDLYRMSRAYAMWTLQPGDELATQLKNIGADDPLAITPDVLQTAAAGMESDYTDVFTQELDNAGEWFPKEDHQGVWWPPPTARGTRVTFTHATHPDFIEKLRTRGTATIGIQAPRAATTPAESVFSGYADIRITKVRPWVFGAKLGAKPAKTTIRVDLMHTGHETIMAPDDTAMVFSHDPVSIAFEFPPAEPDDPGAITVDGTLFDTVQPAPASMIGPFTRWQLVISKTYNDRSLDISGIDKVELEFFGHQRPYLPPQTQKKAEPATVAVGASAPAAT